MTRITVTIPNELYDEAVKVAGQRLGSTRYSVSASGMIQHALAMYCEVDARPAVSERGRTETLRAVRAAKVALEDVEATLTQAAPVRRRVRRSPRRAQPKRGT